MTPGFDGTVTVSSPTGQEHLQLHVKSGIPEVILLGNIPAGLYIVRLEGDGLVANENLLVAE